VAVVVGRVVQQDVDPAGFGFDAREDGLQFIEVRQVALDELRCDGAAGQLGFQFARRAFRDVEEKDLRALAGERGGRCRCRCRRR
jgi:hypothetical protein